MNGEFRSPVIDLADAKLVEAALDDYIQRHQEIDRAHTTSDSTASAAIRRAADARHQLHEVFGVFDDVEAAIMLPRHLGSVALNGLTSGEFVEVMRVYSESHESHTDAAKRSSYLADSYDS
jgi:hypothetical protein